MHIEFMLKGLPMVPIVGSIQHAALSQLLSEGTRVSVEVVGVQNGWCLAVDEGPKRQLLAAKRGATRVFRHFETLVAYLNELGISQYKVDASEFHLESAVSRRLRPDASARLRDAFAAQSHVDWLSQKVAASLADPQPGQTHSDVMAEAQGLIDAARQSHGKTSTS